MYAITLAGLLLVASTARAQGSPEPPRERLQEIYSHLQNGLPPSGDRAAATAAAVGVSGEMQSLHQQLEEESSDLKGNCHRFSATAIGLIEDLRQSLAAFTAGPLPATDDDFELANRLRIGGSAFATLDTLVNLGGEGGFEVLMPSSRIACGFPHRDGIRTSFHTALAKLQGFFQTAFGVPGLRGIIDSQQHLLRLSSADQSSERKKFWTVMTVGTVASVVAWQYAPEVALTAVQRLWGYSPSFLSSSGFAYGARVTALSAEALAFSYALDLTQPAVPPVTLFGGWMDAMDGIEFFLESPIHAPEMEFNYLSRIEAGLFAGSAHILNLLPDAGSTKQLIQLLQMTAGASVQEQLRRLPKWIETGFNFSPTCSRFFGWGVSDDQCLIGMRELAKGLILNGIPRPPETLTVSIDSGAWRQLDANSRRPALQIPYDADSTRMRYFISAELRRPDYKQRQQFLRQIDSLKVGLENETGARFEIEDRLNNLTAVNGLYTLTMLAQDIPSLFRGRSDVIKISDHFQLPYEETLRLKEDVDANADLSHLRQYFSSTERLSRPLLNDQAWPDTFFAERQNLEGRIQHLSQRTGIPDIVCSDMGQMRQSDCLIAVARLQTFLGTARARLPAAQLLTIVDRSVMPDPVDFYFDGHRKILIIRSDIDFSTFLQAFRGIDLLVANSGGEK